MRLKRIRITSRFKNLENFELDFSDKEGITVLIGNNGSGKSNILEAISSIFAGLYNRDNSPNFNYILSYVKDVHDIEVKFENGVYEFKDNGNLVQWDDIYLPNQVICCYSGEENRLWIEYYESFHKEYTRALRGATFPKSKLVYIDKSYWNIALLTLHLYDFDTFTDIRDFCLNTLNINAINYVRFNFDIPKFKEWLKSPNPVTYFVNILNPNLDEQIRLNLNEIKDKVNEIGNEIDFFRYLSASYNPSDDKIITQIEIDINNNLLAESLSEGEKKLLLVLFFLEVIGDEHSLILLDEPDSHIHISRKEEIQKLLSKYTNRENIITTHSPTLIHNFDIKHISMLTKNANNDAQVESKEKQEIVHNLTNGIWTYMQQNIFLSSNKDILLLEGKYDEIFLSKALDCLKSDEPSYNNLDFVYFPCGGAAGIKLLADKFIPKTGQSIIALFDSDETGWKCINSAFGEKNKWSSSNFHYQKQKEVWIAVYPPRKYFRGSNFNIEDYFTKGLLNKYVHNFKSLHDIKTKDKIKEKMALDCINFNKHEFRLFKTVFDLILEIKAKN
ncbi:MAG: AAA family ATPase [Ignavibacteria bacterium]